MVLTRCKSCEPDGYGAYGYDDFEDTPYRAEGFKAVFDLNAVEKGDFKKLKIFLRTFNALNEGSNCELFDLRKPKAEEDPLLPYGQVEVGVGYAQRFQTTFNTVFDRS